MIVMKYICDRCTHEQDTGKQMWKIGISIKSSISSSPMRSSRSESTEEKLWCRKCLETFGLLPVPEQELDKSHVIAPKPTLEDLIREIVVEETTSVAGAVL